MKINRIFLIGFSLLSISFFTIEAADVKERSEYRVNVQYVANYFECKDFKCFLCSCCCAELIPTFSLIVQHPLVSKQNLKKEIVRYLIEKKYYNADTGDVDLFDVKKKSLPDDINLEDLNIIIVKHVK